MYDVEDDKTNVDQTDDQVFLLKLRKHGDKREKAACQHFQIFSCKIFQSFHLQST